MNNALILPSGTRSIKKGTVLFLAFVLVFVLMLFCPIRPLRCTLYVREFAFSTFAHCSSNLSEHQSYKLAFRGSSVSAAGIVILQVLAEVHAIRILVSFVLSDL